MNKMTRILAAAFLLSGCAAEAEPVPTPVRVEVPVPVTVYCPTPHLVHPALGLSALTPDSPPADTIRAYAAAVAMLEGAVSERDDVIAGCIKPSDGGQERLLHEEQNGAENDRIKK